MQVINVEKLKKAAKVLKKQLNITHIQALDRIAIQHGFNNWSLLSKFDNENQLKQGVRSIYDNPQAAYFKELDFNLFYIDALHNHYGLTALHVAAFHNRIDLMQWLLDDHRANINSISKDGQTVLGFVLSPFTSHFQNYVFKLETLEFVLKNNANVQQIKSNEISSALEAGNIDAVKLLVKYGHRNPYLNDFALKMYGVNLSL